MKNHRGRSYLSNKINAANPTIDATTNKITDHTGIFAIFKTIQNHQNVNACFTDKIPSIKTIINCSNPPKISRYHNIFQYDDNYYTHDTDQLYYPSKKSEIVSSIK